MKHLSKGGALLLVLALTARFAQAEPPKSTTTSAAVVLPPVQPLVSLSADSVSTSTPLTLSSLIASYPDAGKPTETAASSTPATACCQSQASGCCPSQAPGSCPTQGSGCCSSGNGCCCFTDCCEHCKMVGGVGVYILQPYFTNNPAISAHVQSTGPETRNDISNHITAAPLIWLGVMNNDGLGIRGRWWSFRQSTDQTFNFGPGDGGLAVLSAAPLGSSIYAQSGRPYSMEVTSKLEFQVVDLEVFQDTTFCNWNLLLSGGVSYADIMQDYGATLNPYFVGGSPLNSHTSFVGFGPVLALEARRPICCCANIYGSTRTRLLYGNTTQTVSGGDQLHGDAVSNQNGIVAAEELELGLEYARTVGRSRFFGQIAMVGQEWFGGGNASHSSFSGPKTSIANYSTEDSSNFGLFGLALRLGMNY